jgi:regulating synaptic membrane exocytosis protein 2
VSADGQRMIGHMILRKNIDGEDILGLKIIGGMTLPSSSRKGAIIEKVKRGSIAELEGHLRVGKNINTKKKRKKITFLLPVFFCCCHPT